MDILIEIIFGHFIAHFLGLNTRYYFFRVIGKTKNKDYLRGDKTDDSLNVSSQYMFNMIIGLIVFFGIVILLINIGV